MIYIGIDCGIKSLAIIALLSVNESVKILQCNVYSLTNKNINQINIHNMIEISKNLKNVLMAFDKEINKFDIKKKILIEYQMNINYKSNYICSQIIYHYIDYEIQIINPSLKNSIHFAENLTYANYIEKYITNYTANKNHTKDNFLYWLNKYGLISCINHIPKSNIDDIADAFMMCIAYITSNTPATHRQLPVTHRQLPVTHR